ncbi:MAG TPA: NIPSNAP family protein, partial [Gemmatales bacterium]|nr:NIPSNAP family protein [Gemmatales bacterium]
MIRILCGVLGCLLLPVLQAQEPVAGMYELRVYTVQPEKLQATHTFISQVALPYLNKYQLKLIGAWSPVDTGDARIFLLVSHESKEACQKNWEALQNDSQWNRDLEAFHQEGAPVTGITRIFLKTWDYSPRMTPAVVGNRLFELRTYLASEGNLARLNNRFRNHTLKLFEKHGMTNLGYFQVATDDKLTCGDLMK